MRYGEQIMREEIAEERSSSKYAWIIQCLKYKL